MTDEQKQQAQAQIQDMVKNIDQYEAEDQAKIRNAAQAFGVPTAPEPPAGEKQITPQNSAFPFLGRLLDQASTNVGEFGNQMSNLGGGIWNMLSDPRTYHDPIYGLQQVGQAAKGFGQDYAQQAQRAVKMQQPGGLLPLFGGDIMNVQDRLKQGDVGGATADVLGLGAQLAGPELLGGAEGKVASRMGKTGERMYTRALGLPMSMTLDDMKAVGKMGTQLELPVGSLLGIKGTGEEALRKLGGPKDPGSYIGAAKHDADAMVAAKANVPVDYNKVFEPLKKQIDQYRGAVRGGAQADQLQQMAQEFMEQHGFITNNQVPGIIPQAQAGAQIFRGQKIRDITVGEAQRLKQNTYGILPDNTWSDTRQTLGPVEKQFNELLAQGLRSAIEDKVPEVGEANQRMHIGIHLRDAIETSEKRGAYGATPEDVGPVAAGAAMGQLGAATGSPYSGIPGITSTLAARGARWPAVRSRLGISLANRIDPSNRLGQMLGLLPLAGQVSKNSQ